MQLKRKDKIYYARIIPSHGIYDIYDLTVRTVTETWFVGIDKRDKHAFLFNVTDIGHVVFLERNEALRRVREAENNKNETVNNEIYYEEY